jgi:hypothetical protein
LSNVSSWVFPLKGVLPKIISNIKIPKVHQSTDDVWPKLFKSFKKEEEKRREGTLI